MTLKDPLDPKQLIREAFRIEGISAPECRSIFLDWALSYEGDGREGIEALLDRYAAEPKDHPMTVTLLAGLDSSAPAKRRGGRAARVADE